jgi:uncharacterized membrane protein YhiD involved in acid resistance
MNEFFGMQDVFIIPFTTGDILRNLSVALFCGLLVALFYVGTTGRFHRSRTFLTTLVVLAMITAVVIMVIGNNLARAFGLVGAMSIIRFRTAVKDVQDIMFIFFTLTIGMAAGVGLAKVAILGTVFIGAVAMALGRLQVPGSRHAEYVLQLSYESDGDGEPPYIDILHRYFAQYHIVSTQSRQDASGIDVAYYVRLRRRRDVHDAVQAVRSVPGVVSVNLLYDESA